MKESGPFLLKGVFVLSFALEILGCIHDLQIICLKVGGYQNQKPFNTKEIRDMEHIVVPCTKVSR